MQVASEISCASPAVRLVGRRPRHREWHLLVARQQASGRGSSERQNPFETRVRRL